MHDAWLAGRLTSIALTAYWRISAARRWQTVFEIVLKIEGRNLERLRSEVGGHRWQGESKGRVHTSTVTVAVMNENYEKVEFRREDVRIIRTKDSGPGGQNRNKRMTAVVAIHEPTGLSVKAAERKQGQNLTVALEELERRVRQEIESKSAHNVNGIRREMIGRGERGDKIKTYREHDGVVNYHRTGEKRRLKDVLSGII